jgi:hypothetical protein
MPEANGRENRVDVNRRDFLGKSGAVLAAVGVAAHVASSAALGQEASVSPILRQTELQDHMLKADSAMARIGEGIYRGLMDEVAAGAEDLEKILQVIEQVNIRQTPERQAAWKKQSLETADNAKKLRTIAAAVQQRGEKEIPTEVVELYAAAMRSATNCHSTFRVRA